MEIAFEETLKTLMHDQNAVVCVIREALGSAPRKAGSYMLVLENGRIFGSVGGGELEKYCIETALHVYKQGSSITQDLRLGEMNMICGGDVKVEFRFLPSDTPETEVEQLFGIGRNNGFVYIFGGGHVGCELVPVLSHLGFQVVLIDDRPEFASAQRHPMAQRTICADYSDISKIISVTENDYIVIMTHGHIADREVLLQAMRTNASYIGCIGSRRKVEATNNFLVENGIPKEDLGRIHSPIGIDIIGDRPEEIAISIAAELIKRRALKNQTS